MVTFSTAWWPITFCWYVGYGFTRDHTMMWVWVANTSTAKLEPISPHDNLLEILRPQHYFLSSLIILAAQNWVAWLFPLWFHFPTPPLQSISLNGCFVSWACDERWWGASFNQISGHNTIRNQAYWVCLSVLSCTSPKYDHPWEIWRWTGEDFFCPFFPCSFLWSGKKSSLSDHILFCRSCVHPSSPNRRTFPAALVVIEFHTGIFRYWAI